MSKAVEGLVRAVEGLRRAGRRGLIVTGPIGSGKTTLLVELAARLRAAGVDVGGVVSPRILQDGHTVGYHIRNVATGQEVLLCSIHPPGIPFRRFFFSPEGVAFGNRALEQARGAAVVVVDEVGPWELGGGGLAPGVRTVLASPSFVVLAVRPSLLQEVRAWAGLLSDEPVWPLM